MFKTDSFPVSSEMAGERLDRCLQSLTGLSRKKVKSLLDQGRVFVNGRKVIIASWSMKRGDQIGIEGKGETREPTAEKSFLKVVYEDRDLLVIDKDAGVPCERSPIATRPTVVSIINAYFKRKYPHLKTHYLGLVHRLDQETSGLMVYTKTTGANRPLTDQFKRHAIKRRYIALVEGRLEREDGKIEGYLKKSDLLPGGKKVKLSTPESGQRAMTQFRILERYGDASLVEVTLNTGRTHQIRVHMSSIGHPVIGDKIYGEREPTFSRQALHASFLGFHHPATGKKLEFRSEIPRDLRRLVDRLRIRS